MLNWNRAINAGLLGAAAMTVLMLILRSLGWTPINLEMMLGSMVTSTIGLAAWMLGLYMHLVAGAVFGVLYAEIMEHLGRAGWAVGLGIGGLHALLAGLILPLLGAIHPLVQTGTLAPPGLLGSGMGAGGGILFILLHLMFGAIVGAFYVALSAAPEERSPGEPAPRRPSTVIHR